MTPLPEAFYDVPVVDLARALVGKVLVHELDDGLVAGRIVETEAYRGPEDLAAHSAGGRRTRRTEAMFGPAGTVYMFRLYGMHWAFNVVAGALDVPHAVLVRAIEPLEASEGAIGRMLARRFPHGRLPRQPTRAIGSGPGKLCQALALDGERYGTSLVTPPLYIADGRARSVGRSRRINIDYAGPWAERRWRFYERGNPCVSVAPRH